MTENLIQERINELKRLLDIRSGLDLDPNHPLTQTFHQIDSYHQQKEFDLRDTLYGKISLLVKHLQEIEKYDTGLLESFRKKLRKVQDREYFGERLEINIASSLIRNNIKFNKSESPDFKKINGFDVNIECSSAHLTQDIRNEKKLQEKLRRVVLKKSKKDYARPNTALFLDITNIYHHDLKKDFKFTFKENIRSFVKKVLNKSQFGSIILFTYLADPENKTYNSNYNRIDNEIINDNLKNFLESHFPLDNVHFEHHIFPVQG